MTPPKSAALGPGERLEIVDAAALWRWLAEHHGRAEGLWLVTCKKSEGAKYVSREDVLDALIAHGWIDGWIDGRRMKLDAARSMQWVSPRRHQRWALSYKRRAARLEAEGRMAEPGQAAIAAAKRAGLWEAAADVDALRVPEDLRAALDADAAAAAFFDRAAPSYRRNVLRWIHSAKRAETRSKRIAALTAQSALGAKVKHF
ncbi:MAG: YdeI/OmpD-associated family protein [Pseudomonadota bacterium]